MRHNALRTLWRDINGVEYFLAMSGQDRHRIIVLDGYPIDPGDNPWTEIESLGELTVYPRTEASQIVTRAGEAGILITNKTPLTGETISLLPRVSFISVMATGYDVVDIRAARAAGVSVSNVPEYGTRSVAQFVFALLLELAHQVGLHDAAVKAGEWPAIPDYSFWKTPQLELAGATMAVVGYGRIGSAVGDLAHAFGMEVLGVADSLRPRPVWQLFAWCPLEEALRRADVVSLNCSLNEKSRGMINSRTISLMKPDVLLVNTARGGLVVEEDLARALWEGRIGGAALDVVSREPIRPDNPLLSAPRCLITPHMAWATRGARQRLMSATARNIRAFLDGAPINVVNGVA